MEFWKVIGALFRRLYIGPPIVALAIAAAALASHLTPLLYQSSAFLVLATPVTGGVLEQDPAKAGGRANPLLLFNDSLRTTATVLIQSMNTRDVERELGLVVNGTTKVTINDGRTNPELLGSSGPFIYIEGESRTAEAALGVVQRADQRIREELVRRQEALGAPLSTYIAVTYVVAPTAPEPVLTDKLKAAGVVLAATIVFGFIVAYLIDRFVGRGKRRRAARREDPPGPDVVQRAEETSSPTDEEMVDELMVRSR